MSEGMWVGVAVAGAMVLMILMQVALVCYWKRGH